MYRPKPDEWFDVLGKRVSFSYDGIQRTGVVSIPAKHCEHVPDVLTLQLENDADGKKYKSFRLDVIERFQILPMYNWEFVDTSTD